MNHPEKETEKEEPGISEEFSLEIEKYANLEGLSPKEFTQQTIKDRLEKLKKIYPDVEALCPSGCGTKLIRHTFFDVFELDMEPSLQNKEEDLYCPKCGIRWIAEQHTPLNTKETENKTQKIELDIPTGEMVLLQQMAKDKGKDTNKMLSEIITEKINQEEPSSLKTENIQLAKAETCVITLEMVAAQLDESDDISVIKNEIAGDLLVAKISLEYEKTGKVEQEQVKQYVAELF